MKTNVNNINYRLWIFILFNAWFFYIFYDSECILLGIKRFHPQIFLNLLYVFCLPFTLNLLASKLNSRYARIFLIFLFLSIYCHIHFFLIFYKLTRHLDFDLKFLWFNRYAFITTTQRILGDYAPHLFVLSAFILGFFYALHHTALNQFYKQNKKIYLLIVFLSVPSLLGNIIPAAKFRNSFFSFCEANATKEGKIAEHYNQLYFDHLKDALLKNSIQRTAEPKLHAENVFIIQLESLNYFLVNSKITPHLLNAAQKGTLFQNFYSNSVQTIRSMDSILCGTPPSLNNTLINIFSNKELGKLVCLPRVFSFLNYKTFLFSSDDLAFDNTGDFASATGFDYIYDDEILSKDDLVYKSKWGYREDIYLLRVVEYLKKLKKTSNEKRFVYIALGPTNHYPFVLPNDPEHLRDLPFKNPETIREKISNSTYLQDVYLGTFLSLYFQEFAATSSLIILGDHSYPIGIHPSNISNEGYAYEENFRVPFVFIPPQNKSYGIPHVVDQRFSHMDILPAFLEILGLKDQKRLLGISFASCLSNQQNECNHRHKLNLMAQPFTQGYLVLIDYPHKYRFDLTRNTVEYLDLASDPLEKNPLPQNLDDSLKMFDEYFHGQPKGKIYPETTDKNQTSNKQVDFFYFWIKHRFLKI